MPQPTQEAAAALAANSSDESLIGYIVSTYHKGLLPELRRLIRLTEESQAADADAKATVGVAETLEALHQDLEQHFREEETVIFPWILSGGHDMQVKLAAAKHDHRCADWALKEVRRFTRNFAITPDSSAPWRNLCVGLAALELSLREHIRIEEEILFPRVLRRRGT